MKGLVPAFNPEKTLVGAFSVIVKLRWFPALGAGLPGSCQYTSGILRPRGQPQYRDQQLHVGIFGKGKEEAKCTFSLYL